MDMDHHPLTVDIADLQVDRFTDSQTERVGDPDETLHAKRSASVDHLKDLSLGNHFGQCAGIVDLGLIKDFPFSRTGGAVEELDPREGDALGSRGDFLIDDLMQQVGSHVIFGDLGG